MADVCAYGSESMCVNAMLKKEETLQTKSKIKDETRP